MGCECAQQSVETAADRKTLRIALALNGTMFVVGVTAGLWAESTGLIADGLDMLADASAYTLALLAIGRTLTFKRNVARWSGSLLLILSLGIIIDVARRGLLGSEPEGAVMIGFSLLSLAVNITVLRMLSKYRDGEPHLRASWIFTRADVVANIGVFASGLVVSITGSRYADLVVGLAIGLYVLKEAMEILRHASETGEVDRAA